MPEYISDNIGIYSEDFDKEDYDVENSDKENSDEENNIQNVVQFLYF